jgi:hypothetical protein
MILPGPRLTVPGSSFFQYKMTPEVNFRPLYLYIPDIMAIDFEVTSILVDRREVLAGLGAVFAQFFSLVNPDKIGDRTISESERDLLRRAMRLDAPAAPRGSAIVVTLNNLNVCHRNISCSMLGEEAL